MFAGITQVSPGIRLRHVTISLRAELEKAQNHQQTLKLKIEKSLEEAIQRQEEVKSNWKIIDETLGISEHQKFGRTSRDKTAEN